MKNKLFARALVLLLTLVLCLPAFSAVATATDPTAFTNLYSKGTAERGGIDSTGKVVVESALYTSKPIAVSAGDVITFGPVSRTQDFYLHSYAADGSVVDGDVKADALTLNGKTELVAIYSYTVPAGATSIRILLPGDAINTFLVTKNEVFDMAGYVAYWNEPTRAKYVRNFGKYFEPRTDSVLYQKSALFLGDSLGMAKPAGYYYWGWAGRIGEVNDMEYVNAAKSGTAFSNRSTKYGRILEQFYTSDKTDFDYVILEGGINDAWFEAAVGTMTEGFDGPFDPSTFAGGFEETIKIMKERYPNAQYGHIIHYETPDAPYGKIPEAAKYVEMCKKICDKWEIPYLDLFTDTELCYEVIKVDTRENMYDDVHVNVHGYDLLYPVIEEWMAKLGQPELPPTVEDEPSTDEETTLPEAEEGTAAQTEAATDDGAADDAGVDTGCMALLSAPGAALVALTVSLGAGLVRKKRRER